MTTKHNRRAVKTPVRHDYAKMPTTREVLNHEPRVTIKDCGGGVRLACELSVAIVTAAFGGYVVAKFLQII